MSPSPQKRSGAAPPPASPPGKAKVQVFENEEALSCYVADRIARLLSECRSAHRRPVLGLAAGASPRGVYRALAARHEEGLAFDDCVTFILDEYYPMARESEQSFYRQLEPVLDALGVRPENRHRLRGDIAPSAVTGHCAAYEARIEDAGGIDLQLLGVGGNGHIAFNEPGTGPDSRTRLVQLHRRTREDAVSAFGTLSQVPEQGLTMGIGTILEARELVLLVLGSHKGDIAKRLIEEPSSPRIPASYVTRHPGAQILLDPAAAATLAPSALT